MTRIIITTRGMTASIWLSRVLNLHPKFLCVSNILPPSAYNIFGKSESFQPDFDTPPIPAQGKQRDYNTAVVLPERVKLSVDDLFNDLIEHSKSNEFYSYGLIHCFNLGQLNENIEAFKLDRINYKIANIVRSPISYVYTIYNHRVHEYHELPTSKTAIDSFLNECNAMGGNSKLSSIGLNHSVNNAIFYFAVDAMESQLGDYSQFENVRFYNMEELKLDKVIILDFLSFISDGSVDVDEAYISYWLSADNLNVGRFNWRSEKNKNKALNITDREIFGSWPEQWQELFLTYYRNSSGSDLASQYYDMKFIV